MEEENSELYDFYERPRRQKTDAEKLHRFENVVKEIANLVAKHIPNNDTKLVVEEDGLQQIYALYVDNKKLVDFTIEGWQFYFKPVRFDEKVKPREKGSWDSFLEGSIEAIAEFSFLREIKKLGYKTTDPR
jgi:hypothetical protein